MDLTDKNQLLDYLKLHGLWAKKGLSQNFLVDKGALEKIVEAAELKPDDFVVEIGPGLGVLTRELTDKAGEVVAVEMDEKLSELLLEGKSPKLKIICSDILKVNLDEIIGTRKYKVVANIPYHISSRILELFLSRENKPELVVLLVQKEVAERICAKPGEMSTLAVSVQLYGKPEIVDIVPANSFFPAPKVDSAILRIAIYNLQLSIFNKLPIANYQSEQKLEQAFFRCVHVGFSSKRKTLVNNLASGFHIDKKEAFDIIKSIGLRETARAQELSIEDWKKLTNKISQFTFFNFH